MRVLGRVTSINVRKVLWTADVAGLEYTREDWGLPLRDPKVPEFLALNPNGQVPVIVDGQFTLWESHAIMQYLAEMAGPGVVLPQDLQLRARALQWLAWQATELGAQSGYPVHMLLRKTPGYDDPKRLEDAVRFWTGKMEILEGQLAKGDAYVAGEQFTLADIAIGLTVHRWFSVPIERRALPFVGDYYQRLLETPFGAKWMAAETP